MTCPPAFQLEKKHLAELFAFRPGVPSNVKAYRFFNIEDRAENAAEFVRKLKTYTFTSAKDALAIKEQIEQHKEQKMPGTVLARGQNIAFTKVGLRKVSSNASSHYKHQ